MRAIPEDHLETVGRAGGALRLPGFTPSMAKIRISNLKVGYEARPGDSLLDLNLDGGVDATFDWGGNCACSTCKVVVQSGRECLSPQGPDERETLEAYGWDPDERRLSCQARLEREGEVVLFMPDPE